jgi:hypothetical protein
VEFQRWLVAAPHTPCKNNADVWGTITIAP